MKASAWRRGAARVAAHCKIAPHDPIRARDAAAFLG